MWKWIKFPKIVALVAFALPWLTISCSGTPIATGRGYELVLGKLSPVVGPNGSAAPTPTSPAELNIWLCIAVALIVVGLILACLKYSKQLSLAVLGTSFVSLVLIWVGTMGKYSKAAIVKDMPKSGGASGGSPDMDPAMIANAIGINWEYGFWLTIIALVVAAVLAFMAFTGKGAAAAAPDEPPVL